MNFIFFFFFLYNSSFTVHIVSGSSAEKNKGRAENKRTSDTAEAACVIWLAAACYRTYAWDYGR